MPIEMAGGYGMDPIMMGLNGPGLPMMPDAGMGEMMPQASTMPPAGLPPANVGETLTAANQATVVVTLPADAKLFIEGKLIDQTGSVRAFRTPELQPVPAGQSYEYTMSIEVVRNGRTVKSEEKVRVEAGKVARVNFAEPAPGSGNTAQIHVRMPADAVLTVDGRSWSATEGQTIIRTPELRAGQDHFYQLKIEVVRRNERHTMTRDVAFRAGQELQVEFEEPAAAHVAQR
jgi:uncharacterized protein (TIGR03000 family)